MDKKEKNEEIARKLGEQMGYACKSIQCKDCCIRDDCMPSYVAKAAVDAGLQKVQDNEIVITKDEYETLKKGVHTVSYQAMITESDQQLWLDGYKVGYKDGVIAVGVQTKQALEKIETELIGETDNEK